MQPTDTTYLVLYFFEVVGNVKLESPHSALCCQLLCETAKLGEVFGINDASQCHASATCWYQHLTNTEFVPGLCT
jgi:hypothetical protein